MSLEEKSFPHPCPTENACGRTMILQGDPQTPEGCHDLFKPFSSSQEDIICHFHNINIALITSHWKALVGKTWWLLSWNQGDDTQLR